jgi:hypothetical protein
MVPTNEFGTKPNVLQKPNQIEEILGKKKVWEIH